MQTIKTSVVLLCTALLFLSCTATVQVQSLPAADPEVNNVKITLPAQADLWCGWRQDLALTLENPYPQNKTVAIYARTPVNVFLNGHTTSIGHESDPVEVMRVTIPASQTLQTSLEVQSLRVGEYPIVISWGSHEITLNLTSKPFQHGAAFMYRCWFESSEFFYPVWSDGRETLDGRGRKAKIFEQGKAVQGTGASRSEAERLATQKVWETFPFVEYRKLPDWEQIYQRKKNQHTESYGFQYADVDGLGWDDVERIKGQYDWTLGDFMVNLICQDFQSIPYVRIEVSPQWAVFAKSQRGRLGFYDEQNEEIMSHWEKYCQALAERYDGDGVEDAPGSPVINYYTLINEPEGYWLNVDFDNEGWPVPSADITQTRWWKEAVAQGEVGGQAYAKKFGDLVYAVTRRAAEALHRANPNARVASPQFAGILQVTEPFMRYLVDKGLGQYVDAWGVHPGNLLGQLWRDNPSVNWWVGDEANQAPPFEFSDFGRTKGGLDLRGQTMETARPLDQLLAEYSFMGKMWCKLIDEAFSRQMEPLNRMFAAKALDLPFWAGEELTIGPLATNRRENLIAALREYSIVFHQKMEISVLAGWIDATTRTGDYPLSYLPDPTAKNLILDVARTLVGSQPVEKFDCRWFVPPEGKFLDYRWTVCKLFTRGNEDILAIWNNSAKNEILDFTLNANAPLRQFQITKYDGQASTFKQTLNPSQFPASLTVAPLKDFYFISVTSNQPGFGWLKNLVRRTSAEEQELAALLDKTTEEVETLKVTLKRQNDPEVMRRARMVPRVLAEAEVALMSGDLTTARDNLNRIQDFLRGL